MNDVVVSTECPTCGAPLDFAHGTNAIQCGHCGSHLLVTGHRQVLSYQVESTIDARAAVAQVRAALGTTGDRPGEPELYFVPYYRLTGHEFRWLRAAPRAPERDGVDGVFAELALAGARGDDLHSTLDWARSLVAGLLDVPMAPDTSASCSRPTVSLLRDDRVQRPAFQDRYVDRSFLAVDLPELGVASLGVRASVLRLRLLASGLRAGGPIPASANPGRLVAPTMSSDEAVACGMRPPDASAILHRTVIGRVLAVIYFPFWVVPFAETRGSRLAIVDGLASTVVRTDAPETLRARLDHRQSSSPAGRPERPSSGRPEGPSSGRPEIVGFRPLVCPNCGGDLPVRPDDVIFCCGACRRAWQLRGADLVSIKAEVADVAPAHAHGPVRYLPCWVLDTAGGGERLFAPAFRARRLKLLSDLGARFTSRQPTWSTLPEPPSELEGGHYDLEDALMLARFIRLGRENAGGSPPEPTITAATLTWFPFTVEQRQLIDPFTGLALPEQAMLPDGAPAEAPND